MLESSLATNFHRELRNGLLACGYKSHGKGVFTRGDGCKTSDWLSITGNPYFYLINAGVVFANISSEMRDALPGQSEIMPLDGVSPLLVPFVFSPASRYIELPSRGKNPSASSALTIVDAQELLQCLCALLPKALSRFHDLEQAVMEVEETLETGGAKVFLLVLAYLKLGKSEAAASFARRAVTAFKPGSTRSFYEGFLRNVESSHSASLCQFER